MPVLFPMSWLFACVCVASPILGLGANVKCVGVGVSRMFGVNVSCRIPVSLGCVIVVSICMFVCIVFC